MSGIGSIDPYAVAFTVLAAGGVGAGILMLRKFRPKSVAGQVGTAAVLLTASLLGAVGLTSLWHGSTSPSWEQPKTEQERKAYEFAHAIVLPDSIPRPVPFSFAKAKLLALVPGMPSVAEQYHKHLCDTESGVFILQTAENVEGFMQLRPRHRYTDEMTTNPKYVESFLGWHAGQRYEVQGPLPEGGPVAFVQPRLGQYLFLEQPSLTTANLDRIFRDLDRVDPRLSKTPSPDFDPRTQTRDRVPYMLALEEDVVPKSKYGYTWRGIKRPADRDHWIVGGETIVLALESQQILGVRRDFVRRVHVGTKWGRDFWCGDRGFEDDNWLIPKVLKPIAEVNASVPSFK